MRSVEDLLKAVTQQVLEQGMLESAGRAKAPWLKLPGGEARRRKSLEQGVVCHLLPPAAPPAPTTPAALPGTPASPPPTLFWVCLAPS